MKKSFLFALTGGLLGLGAPLGAFFFSWFFYHPSVQFRDFLLIQCDENHFFYSYMLIGTCLSYSLFGFVLGRYADKIHEKNQLLSKEALTDPLTGLGNHRFLHEEFQKLYQDRRDHSEPISCLMMDLDLFKKVNDTYGHPSGDRVLADFARIIRKGLRPGDIATRYGGEEFLCILPRCGKDEAVEAGERVRREMEKYVFYFNNREVRVTVSVGAATHRDRIQGYQALIQSADQALYQAKSQGRNRVAAVGPESD
jgi:diguanylate cyclase (GGDEF)-like protein